MAKPDQDNSNDQATLARPCHCGSGGEYDVDRVLAVLEIKHDYGWSYPYPWMTLSGALPAVEVDTLHIDGAIHGAYSRFGTREIYAPERTAHIVLEGLWRHPRWGRPVRFTAGWLVLREAPMSHRWPPKWPVVPSEDFFETHSDVDRLSRWLRSNFVISESV